MLVFGKTTRPSTKYPDMLGWYEMTFVDILYSFQSDQIVCNKIHSLCRYRKWTDIYYSTWSLENVSKSCQFQFFRPPPPQNRH